jgi:hypothetical protein
MYFEVAGDGTHILTPEHAFEKLRMIPRCATVPGPVFGGALVTRHSAATSVTVLPSPMTARTALYRCSATLSSPM